MEKSRGWTGESAYLETLQRGTSGALRETGRSFRDRGSYERHYKTMAWGGEGILENLAHGKTGSHTGCMEGDVRFHGLPRLVIPVEYRRRDSTVPMVRRTRNSPWVATSLKRL